MTSLSLNSCVPLFRINHGITNEHKVEHKVCPARLIYEALLDIEIPTIPRWHRQT
jgi:hypothetical protein